MKKIVPLVFVMFYLPLFAVSEESLSVYECLIRYCLNSYGEEKKVRIKISDTECAPAKLIDRLSDLKVRFSDCEKEYDYNLSLRLGKIDFVNKNRVYVDAAVNVNGFVYTLDKINNAWKITEFYPIYWYSDI